jgi:CMP-N,N'-diacetyllegionaminic acid synthase
VLGDKTFLAVIPARGASKRVPRKNALLLGDKPLIAWSIEAAKKSRYIDRVVVSSDDDEILSIAKEFGADMLKRPKELATDTATTFDTIVHVIENMEKSYEYIVLLQPTSPLRESIDIDEAIEMLEQKGADGVVSVCEMEHSPLWSNTLPDDMSMQNFLKDEVINKRSQDLQKYYRLNGAIYIVKIDKFLKQKSLFLDKNTFAFEMSQERSIDIDTKLDFKIANSLIF